MNPDAMFSISFQLSFVAVAGILLLTPFFLDLLPNRQGEGDIQTDVFRRIFLYFWGLMAVTVSATLFLLPITALYFHRISLVSVPANMTVVPILAFWVIPSGLLCAVTLPLSTAISAAFLHLGTWGLDLMMAIVAFWADIPWASMWVIIPNLFEISLFYALLLSLFFIRKIRWAKVGLVAVLILIGVDVGYWIHRVNFGQTLRVTFLDVGKGNAALVEFPGGKRMIIDGGGFSSGRFDVGEMVVAPFLWRSKVLHVDYLVLSHPQSDHMNGLRFIAKHFNPREFWFSGDVVDTPSFQELLQIVKTKGIRKRIPSEANRDRVINDVRVEILHPFPEENKSAELKDGKWLNNRSMVLKITYKGTSFLFPGDLEASGENELMLRAGKRLKSQILLAPHHGSNTSSSAALLEAVHPRLCVISSGEGNPNFPHKAVLDRLRRIGCRVICTARSGAVQIEARPESLNVETFVDPSDSR
ncbi:MAG: DNA internalization-related competence protein ComEC/Rec2 [Deltaproteobacteria bacterium]|nr:DNA internalization-related competence protein ComEC/Rec2 [Deltaproteobacteria bacterium]